MSSAKLQRPLTKRSRSKLEQTDSLVSPIRVARKHSTASDSSPVSMTKKGRESVAYPGVPFGSGQPGDPICIPLRDVPNNSGCVFCPYGVEECQCSEMKELLWSHFESVTSTQRVCGKRHYNSKSIYPVFVTRLIRLMKVDKKRPNECFWDLGCGNGSVLMQVALQTGVNCVGVDHIAENIDLAEKVWPKVRAEYLRKHPGASVGSIQFIASDMFPLLAEAAGIKVHRKKDGVITSAGSPPTVVWVSNLLFDGLLNARIAESIMQIPTIRAVASCRDIFPHSRGYGRKRNADVFERFTFIQDHRWQAGAVEWSEIDEEPFFTYMTKD